MHLSFKTQERLSYISEPGPQSSDYWSSIIDILIMYLCDVHVGCDGIMVGSGPDNEGIDVVC